MDFLSQLQVMAPTVLKPIVEQALGEACAELREWHCQPIGGGSEQYTGRGQGLYRLAGTAQCASGLKPWSVVLKVKGGDGSIASDDPAAPEYWKREALVYQSGY